ncbi:MAG: glycosyltransferase [Proteobacteria bacterium]|nr:glycosyltransferase [Pseudomonadota bacterium]
MTTLLWLMAAYWFIRVIVVRHRIDRGWFAADRSSWPEHPKDPPSVSICVPARNEAGSIGDCVTCLLSQDWPNVRELIVIDDRSDDGTAEEAIAASMGDSRLRVILGDGPPPGWMGKSAALWNAQGHARGDWLFFVDADVALHPRALTVAMGAARHYGADMISWLGQLETRTFWEHVAMPFIGDLIALFSPLVKVNDPDLDDCLANGQMILISRSAYDAIGGHEAIKDSVVDDISMSRAVKHGDNPYRYVLLQSLGLMRVRMYDSLSAIWAGFSKNFYAAAKQDAKLLGILVVYLILTSILPAVALVGGLATGNMALAVPAAAAFAGTLAYRQVTATWNPAPGWAVLLHPLGALVTVGIVIDSALQGLGLRQRVKWKGR